MNTKKDIDLLKTHNDLSMLNVEKVKVKKELRKPKIIWYANPGTNSSILGTEALSSYVPRDTT